MTSGSKEEEGNLWWAILTEVQTRSSASLPQASVVVLGDADSGKTSLVAKLQRKEPMRTGAGLEFHYMDVNPDCKDGTYAYQLGSALGDPTPGESGRLGVWVMDGQTELSPLLRYALPPALLPSSAVLLCASMSEPWSIIPALHRWTKFLEAFLSTQDQRLLTQCREAQVRFWQEYVEPLDSSSHSDLGAKVPSMETEHLLLPLAETTLTHNLGVPVIVVITKCDYISTLEKDYDFKEEHFDFIQSHIRKFCLNYGAALFFTSAKEGRNCDSLYKYLLHRLYEFPFTHPATVVDKDSIFIPAGWDNEKKIGILHENLRNMRADDLYSEHIKKPVLRRPQPKDAEVAADDDQSFLARAQAQLAATPATASPGPQKAMSTDSPSLPTRTLKPAASVTSAASPKLVWFEAEAGKAGAAGVGANEGVLAHFFNNLLKGKEGEAPPSPNNNAANAPVSVNGDDLSESQKAAELSRMLETRGRKEAESAADS